MEAKQPRYRRVLLKMSGEALTSEGAMAISPPIMARMVAEIAEIYQLGVQIGIVIGGGNFFRGATLAEMGVDRVTGDQMGMISTILNALALRDVFVHHDIPARILSAVTVGNMVTAYNRELAIELLQQGKVVIFAGGTGNPFITTDSAASLRSIEIRADVMLKATRVDGVYSADPKKNPAAILYKTLTYREALQKELAVMDLGAFTQCRDYDMPIIVFNFTKSGALRRVILGEEEGTRVAS